MAKPTDQFRVPSMADLDPDYAALTKQRGDLHATLQKLNERAGVARRELEAAIAKAPSVSAAVAELVGDKDVIDLRDRRTEVAEIRSAISNHETAIGVIERRIQERTDRSGRLVIAAVRPEFDRRVKALAEALKVVEKLRDAVEQIRIGVEAEGVSSGPLGADLHFLGDYNIRTGSSFNCDRVARAAGVL